MVLDIEVGVTARASRESAGRAAAFMAKRPKPRPIEDLRYMS